MNPVDKALHRQLTWIHAPKDRALPSNMREVEIRRRVEEIRERQEQRRKENG